VILDHEDGIATSLAIVDYKTSIRDNDPRRDLQLRVYSDAGRREGLDVRAAYIHDMKLDNRSSVDISAA
jgi:DNA helicase II / ATP-dependent DNA helicase PcrA